MKPVLAALVLAAVLLAGCLQQPVSEEIKQLQEVEVQKYEGENLSSVAGFRENSIKGPQNVPIDSYRLLKIFFVSTISSMDRNFYEQYHRQGIGKGSLVQNKIVPLNSRAKAHFVQGFLKGLVLDVGCGGGFDAAYFKSQGFEVQGCDISKAAVVKAKKRFPEVSFFLHNFEERPLKKKFDTVVCIDVIEHLFLYRGFLRNLYLTLNKGGILVVSTPNVFGLKSWLRLIKKDGSVFGLGTEDESHIRFFSVKTLEQALKDAGFRVRVLKTFSQGGFWLLGHWNGSIVAVAEK